MSLRLPARASAPESAKDPQELSRAALPPGPWMGSALFARVIFRMSLQDSSSGSSHLSAGRAQQPPRQDNSGRATSSDNPHAGASWDGVYLLSKHETFASAICSAKPMTIKVKCRYVLITILSQVP